MELSVNHSSLKIKAFLGFFENLLLGNNNKSDDLLVLNFHGTQKKFNKNFEKQIVYLNKYFSIVSPDFLGAYYSQSNKTKTSKRPVLITFDDGIKNNLFAVEILKRYNIKALFFVIPDFIDAFDQPNFYQSNIRPLIDKQIEGEKEDTTAMSWDDLKQILNEGHMIGSHSQTHLLKANMSAEQSEKEIVNSKKAISEKLGLADIKNFCAPNDSLYSVGKLQMVQLKNNYSFFHSTYPGKNLITDPYFIRRVNVECYWPLNALKFAVGRFDNLRFKDQNKRFQEIAGTI